MGRKSTVQHAVEGLMYGPHKKNIYKNYKQYYQSSPGAGNTFGGPLRTGLLINLNNSFFLYFKDAKFCLAF
jgi:hypothetical protein